MAKKILFSLGLASVVILVIGLTTRDMQTDPINQSEVEYYQLRIPGSTVYHNEQVIDDEQGVSLGLAVEVVDNKVINYQFDIVNSKSLFPYKTEEKKIIDMQSDVLRVETYIDENLKFPDAAAIDLVSLNIDTFVECYQNLDLPQGVEYDKDSIRKYHS